MSTEVGPRRLRSSSVLSVALCVVLLPLSQAALGYLSGRGQSPWYWLAGTPLCYLLICGLGAFCATGGLAPAQARRKGSLFGIIAGAGGAVVSALIVAVMIAWFLNDIKAHPSVGSRLPGPGLAVVLLFFWFVPLFLGLNLLGIALAALGGMCGGYLRVQSRQEGRPAPVWPGERERARPRVGVVAAVSIALLLAMLMGVAFFVLTTGAFPVFK
ncbi:MAG TPA: hypothetical protein VF844_15095 [Ktedonobacteraceae bacterium]